jgi:hypothetical protein
MDESRPEIWTDDQVRRYLISQRSPLNGWWYSEQGGYGFCDESGQAFACADDLTERAIRIQAFLRKIGAQTFEQVLPTIHPPQISS